MIKRSESIKFEDYILYSDEDYSDFMQEEDSFSYDDGSSQIFAAPMEHFIQLFKVQDFLHSKSTHYLPFSDTDYDFAALNTPILPIYPKKLSAIKNIFIMCAQPSNSVDSETSSYNEMPTLFMWKNVNGIIPSNFLYHFQEYFSKNYQGMKSKAQIRLYFLVNPSLEKLLGPRTVRRDNPSDRILFHYIGYGFPTINENIFAYDACKNSLTNHRISALFENMKTPSWFIFDCDNAESAMNEIKLTADMRKEAKEKNDKTDWDDWICFCATSNGEALPTDPHLPKDFLTSCLFKPTKIAVLCHILQFYRTNLISENWSMDDLESNLLASDNDGKPTELHESLNSVLEALTDAIAADSLPFKLYFKLFRTDKMITKLFQRFLLAQYLLRLYQIHPKCNPDIPNLSNHCLWQHWRETVDIAVISSASRNFLSEVFSRSYKSFANLKEQAFYDEIPKGMLSLVSHPPNDIKEEAKSIRILASFAAETDENKKMVSKYVRFEHLFHVLVSKEIIQEKSVIHPLCYLILTMLNENFNFSLLDPLEFNNFSNLTAFLFDKELPEDTRALVAAIIATFVPNNDRIRQDVSNDEIISSLKTSLETSGPELSLWLLIIERKLFDGYALELLTFYNFGVHIQTGSFCLHFAPEVRAAALATLPCLLNPNSDTVNMHLFGLSMLCGFDGSYIVRYNFVLFLNRFLSIYRDKINGHIPIGLLAHQLFGCVVATWAGVEGSDLVSLGEIISNFDKLIELITQIMRTNDAIQRFVGIGLFLADYLSDDPNPSVKEAATALAKMNTERAGLRRKISNTSNTMSFPTHGNSLTAVLGSLPSMAERKDSKGNIEPIDMSKDIQQVSYESGGDALYKSCMSQLVRSGCWKEREYIKVASNHSAKTTTILRPEKVIYRGGFEDQPTSIAYDSMSRDCVIGFENGVMRYICNDDPDSFSEIKLTSKITSLELTTVNGQTCAIAGTDDGCCHIWDGISHFPQQCFRADGLPKTKVPQLVSVLNNKPYVLTARGNCGSLKLWDIRAQRLVNEWVATQNNKDNIITAMTVDPVTSQCYLGHSTGLIALVDVRSEEIQKIPDFNSCGVQERIMKIKGNVSSTKHIYAATTKGNISVWSNFQSSIVPFMRLDQCEISSIDFHITQPLICISTNQSIPTVLTKEGSIVAELKECSPGALVGFHPSLPIVGACTKEGKFYEYDLSNLI